MKRSPRFVFPLLALLLLAFLLPGCDDSAPGPPASSVSGVVYAPNGVDPVPGAEVRAVRAGAVRTGPFAPASWLEGAAAGTAVSGPDGRFSIGGLAPGEYTLVITQGLFRTATPVSLVEGVETQVEAAQTTLPNGSGGEGETGAPRIAVVTGAFDEMANVLAKFGMGRTDDHGSLILGTETFTLYLGSEGRDVWDPEAGAPVWQFYPEGYPLADALFRNLAEMRRYDIIVLNCGIDESSFLDAGEPGVRWNLREFVRLGGRLYVTDLANSFVEETFPGFVRFEGGGDTPPADPEPLYAAWTGMAGITSEAAVLDAGLAAWLGGLGALADNGALHIEDFLGGWAVMSGPEPTPEGGQVKVWVEGPTVLEVRDGEGNDSVVDGGVRPLTISFPFGGGKVIYTSYHTAGTPHPGFTPQERVLEYLLFQ